MNKPIVLLLLSINLVVVIIDGFSVIDIRDDRVKDVTMFAATTPNHIFNSTNNLMAQFRIISAANQIASGQTYKMELEFKPSDEMMNDDSINNISTTRLQQQLSIKCISDCSRFKEQQQYSQSDELFVL